VISQDIGLLVFDTILGLLHWITAQACNLFAYDFYDADCLQNSCVAHTSDLILAG